MFFQLLQGWVEKSKSVWYFSCTSTCIMLSIVVVSCTYITHPSYEGEIIATNACTYAVAVHRVGIVSHPQSDVLTINVWLCGGIAFCKVHCSVSSVCLAHVPVPPLCEVHSVSGVCVAHAPPSMLSLSPLYLRSLASYLCLCLFIRPPWILVT